MDGTDGRFFFFFFFFFVLFAVAVVEVKLLRLLFLYNDDPVCQSRCRRLVAAAAVVFVAVQLVCTE